MDDAQALRILTINSGSSSVKFALFQMGQAETLLFSGRMERIGLDAGVFKAKGADGAKLLERQMHLPDHAAAFQALFDWLRDQPAAKKLDAVGHRIVHGGPKYTQPQIIDSALIESLKKLIPLAPEHLPHQVVAIENVSRLYPALTQVACFDTAFHADMPRLAKIYSLPRQYEAEGLRRYGFHGLSYEYIMSELKNEDAATANGRIVIAHLGNGSSMAAVREGNCLDTTMGFTPTGGLVMSTRIGDVDPGVIIYLQREKGLTATQVNELVTQKAGLLGISGTSSDMADLLEREKHDPNASEAVELFCRQAKKFLAAFAGVLGGLDTVIFTAGIGENCPSIRSRICDSLSFAGIQIDQGRNDTNARNISADGSRVRVGVIKTNEELMIARHCLSRLRATNPKS
jgi:acetate kinase